MEQRDYWIKRWEAGNTGWHQREVEPALVQHFGGMEPTRVLVPLCGKSLDLQWLASQGHEVIGVELSELACQTFFSEQGLKPTVLSEGGFRVYRSGTITLYNGDFFELAPERVGPIGAIYDRAALIALPRELRMRYSSHLKSILRAKGSQGLRFLQIVLERIPVDEQGPPFSVTQEELERLYGDLFRIEPQSREEVRLGKDGSERGYESVFLLARLAQPASSQR